MKYEKCKYSKCNGNIIPNRSKMFCNKHQELAEFFIWMLENIKMPQEKKTPSGLILPK